MREVPPPPRRSWSPGRPRRGRQEGVGEVGRGQASLGGLGEAPPPAEAEPAGRRRVYQVDWDIVGGGGGASLCRGLHP